MPRCPHTAAYRAWVPNQPATPKRSVRVKGELWDALIRVAHDNGETATDVIIRAIIRYLREHGYGVG